MVGSGGHQYVRVKGSSSGGGRGRGGVVTEGTKINTPGTEHQERVQVVKLTN